MKNTIVSITWLKEHLKDDNLILLDASLVKPVQLGDSSLQNKTIPSARFFDLKTEFSDQTSPYPNTLPSAIQFEKAAQKLGVNQSSKIIVFDNQGVYSSPRVWWMFKAMGHENIAVLDGGLPAWILENGALEEKQIDTEYEQGDFKAVFHSDYLITYEDVLKNLDQANFCIVDARSKGRFEGTAEEPRKNLKSGNIPKAVNIPFQEVLEGGKFKNAAQLRVIFDEKTPKSKNLVFSCGSGLTACIIMLANEIIAKQNRYLFDGSWTEWALRQKLIIS